MFLEVIFASWSCEAYYHFPCFILANQKQLAVLLFHYMCKIWTHWLNILTVAPFCSCALKPLWILKQREHFTCFWKQKTVTAFTGPQAVWFLLICINDSVCVYSVSCKHALHLPMCFQDVTQSSKHTSCFTATSEQQLPLWWSLPFILTDESTSISDLRLKV